MKAQLNQIWNRTDTEIDLFRKISNILSNTYNVAFIQETHQHRVSYYSTAINRIASRELSDLWIITFSPKQKRIRMTFLQAKYHRRDILPTGVFKADFFQYELLSTHATLLTGSSFNFPPDILSFSCCESIGTYGVFYIDSSTSIDMAYCCANKLTAATTPTTYGQISIDLTFPTAPISVSHCTCNTCSELNYTYDIDFFTTNLLQLNIGAELQFYPQILSYVQNVLAAVVTKTVTGAELLELINDEIRGKDIVSNSIFEEGGSPNILIINVDERASH